MKSNRLKIIIRTVLLVYLSFLVFILLFVDDWNTSGTLGDTFGILNTLFSGIALAGVIYTLNLQAQTTELQRKDFARSIQPMLSVEQSNEEKYKYFILKVTNIGNGSALNIEFNFGGLNPDVGLEFKANDIICLMPNQSIEIKVKPIYLDQEMQPEWTSHLDKKYANSVITLETTYYDIEFNNLKQDFDLGLGETKISKVQHINRNN
ncbi:hypothetical protein [Paenibacillus xylanexedens]|uniref:hypothetical protein n=1 Tax=Paenibacillus xylanexedens TaxID=528191 RepID=UPI0011A403ED|nr:hypothetical protein [Paenibacillus xylanexedens]